MEEVVSLQEIALVLKKRVLLIFSMMILGVVGERQVGGMGCH
ncbi:MAG: hypothetical protein E7L30_09545 [Lactococcus lactis]|nr:hypothetical protein [Lactococcus lactis]MDU2186494.1 hypothetical protein [Lactococcus lactis]MDU3891682.1 hypothetical protein [Lactococcus lactis]MDU4037909.1 hypothetical protein [Lactococcus lactis]MDU7039236.1 hypothetical protein [Lactococcus lactis]MDU7301123.1 hypothetical protein [Lactococcus lactis]